MRIRTLFFLSFFVGALSWAVSPARADVIVSGSVLTAGQQGTTCSASAGGGSGVNLACDDSISSATSLASGDAFSGGAYISAFVPATSFPYGFARTEAQLQLNDTYVLTGGTGTAELTFSAMARPAVPSGASASCTFIFDGVGQSCVFSPLTFTETVQYGVPFSIELLVKLNGGSSAGDPSAAQFSYNFYQPGLEVVPTPEPSSALLLLPGLAGVLFVARSRARRLVGRS